jgi:hypothetical protein
MCFSLLSLTALVLCGLKEAELEVQLRRTSLQRRPEEDSPNFEGNIPLDREKDGAASINDVTLALADRIGISLGEGELKQP